MSEPSTPQVVIADVRLPKKYRAMMIVAVLFFSIAAVMGAGIAIGPARTTAKLTARANAETLCRGKINNVLQDANTGASAALNDIVLALALKNPTLPLISPFHLAIDRQKKVAQLAANATASCHADPNYVLPTELVTPSGGPPP